MRGDLPPEGPQAFRRQFITGPALPDDLLPSWPRHPVDEDLRIAVHPDLPVTRADQDDRTIVLLGYLLDPRHPTRGDRDCLDELLRGTTSLDDLVRAFDPLAGRWAAVYRDANHLVVFHDPTGQRSVHFAGVDGVTWCGSTPSLLAHVLGLSPDTDAWDALIGDGLVSETAPHAWRGPLFWPGQGSPYRNVRRLLPNHLLEVRSGQVRRFWPMTLLPRREADGAIRTCGTTLSGVMAAAAARFPLALGLTGGRDSRVLLAASRHLADDLAFYTLRKSGVRRNNSDLRIPRRMARDLGLSHRFIEVAEGPGEIFETITRTVSPFHRSTAHQAQTLASHPPRSDDDWVDVNGNVSEIARCAYPRVDPTPENFALYTHMEGNAFVMAQFAAWHEQALPAITASGINAWDLFYWEQRLGSWLATVRTEFDVVQEVVSPFNCRALLEVLLGVDESLRDRPDFSFYSALIADLWPELLTYPMNPRSRTAAITRRLRALPHRLRSLS